MTRGEESAIPVSIRERIAAASGGLPLYLDLAVTMYLDIVGQGVAPVDDDFGRPLPEVVARILRDLDEDERNFLRTAALLGAFNAAILRAACPGPGDAALLRFTSRPFLETGVDRYWPYSLHAQFRTAIREADTGLRDSWSERERDRAANLAGEYLRETATAATAAGDRSSQNAAIRKAVEVCLDTGQMFSWLPEAIQELLVSGGWTFVGDLPSGDGDSAMSAVLLGLQGARERRQGQLEKATELMNKALSVPSLPGDLRRFLILHRSHALRVAGRYREAADGYRELTEEPGAFTDHARYWLADYDFLQGRFPAVLASLDALPASGDLLGEVLRLRGHVYRVNALFDQAEANYKEALELARQTSNKAAEGKALTDLMQTAAWLQPATALGYRQAATEVNEALQNKVELVKIHAASAVAFAQSGDQEQAAAEIAHGLTLTEECGYPGGQVWCWSARVVHKLKAHDDNGAAAAADRVTAITGELLGNRFWSEITLWWTGIRPEVHSDWLDGPDAARARWLPVPGSAASAEEGH